MFSRKSLILAAITVWLSLQAVISGQKPAGAEPLLGKREAAYYTQLDDQTVHIEKKPLFHMLPGTSAFSIATAGCNLRCKFCQNWTISQRSPEETDNIKMSPEEVVELALKNHCSSIAYTYSEPIIFYEYMRDTAKLAKEK